MPDEQRAGPDAYERYLRTDVLLSLQRDAEGRVDPDEMVFLVVQQSSELWLKLAAHDLRRALHAVHARTLPTATHMVGRARAHVDGVTRQLDTLDLIPPWGYQRIRTQLEDGSGFSSPGWRRVRGLALTLGTAFFALLDDEGAELEEVYLEASRWESFFLLAEALVDLDVACMSWRTRHLKVVERLIGVDAVGVAGTPVEILAKLAGRRLYPRLWEVRSHLTARADETAPDPAPLPH